jgi:hypothetical protein
VGARHAHLTAIFQVIMSLASWSPGRHPKLVVLRLGLLNSLHGCCCCAGDGLCHDAAAGCVARWGARGGDWRVLCRCGVQGHRARRQPAGLRGAGGSCSAVQLASLCFQIVEYLCLRAPVQMLSAANKLSPISVMAELVLKAAYTGISATCQHEVILIFCSCAGCAQPWF